LPAFVDTHAHIQEPEFHDDIDAVIERANAAGVNTIVVPGVDVETSEAAARLADRHPGVYFAAGFHPHEAFRFDNVALNRIRALLQHPRAVAVGEVGLDYYRLHSPREAQMRTFEAMLDLARDAKLPVIVHARFPDDGGPRPPQNWGPEGTDEVERTLTSWAFHARSAYEGRTLGVMHYFSGGDLAQARRYVELGFMISVHTSITHPKATLLREVVRQLPLDSLVIETDSPYGAPQAVRGKRNEPAYVVEAARKVAQLQAVSLEEVARATTANAQRLFGRPLPQAQAVTGARA
jgi:TatD DNase family protein